ncbi:AarF/ABC1/UbiB kinase family protein [Methanosphaera sp. WGK6]|uniref:ABC1 kinase family protein n=1 Tax=Methanosphaera sp. WGK6 TaxID=1561964 RepID=UPI001300FDFC|nr:AarF/UbiB family protein [Methanosphaera sp. WGK6]
MNEIVKILIKYGFEGIAQNISSKNTKFLPVDKLFTIESNVSLNTRIRWVLQDLGTTFIKLGQTLSTYPELVGFDLAEELSKLQESAPITPFVDVKKIIESEFSKSIDEIFDDFSEEPIASASIGQVHKAYLGGVCVAVKVQHPGIRDTVDSDINLMKIIANRLDKSIANTKSYNLPGIVEVFEKDIRKELDYGFEARNAIHLGVLLENDDVYIPKIYQKYSTDKVLVMEFLDGVSLNYVLSSSDEKFDNEKIARTGADSFVKQILVHGFYHADPHPGNIFVLEDNIVAFVDFGMMGHLDSELREDLTKLFIFISNGDAKLLTKQLYHMSIFNDKSLYDDIEYEIMNLLDKYYGVQFNDVSGVLHELIQNNTLNKYGIVIPRDLLMVIRTLIMVDDIGKKLDPSFNTTEILKQYTLIMLLDNFKPKNMFTKLSEGYMDLQYFITKLPGFLLSFEDILNDGKFELSVGLNELSELNNIFSRIINELSLAIITAALIVGSSLIMLTDNGYYLFGYPFLGFIGFVFSAVLGVILIIMILRRGNY